SWRLPKCGGQCHKDSGCAEATLNSPRPDELVLEAAERATGNREPLDRLNRAAVYRHGCDDAGVRCLAVDENSAGAAFALVASTLGPGQEQTLAEHVEQCRVWFHLESDRTAVHGDVKAHPRPHGARVGGRWQPPA